MLMCRLMEFSMASGSPSAHSPHLGREEQVGMGPRELPGGAQLHQVPWSLARLVIEMA